MSLSWLPIPALVFARTIRFKDIVKSRRHVRGPAPVARPFVQVRTRAARVTEPSLMHGGRTMGKYSEAFVAFDVAEKKHAIAIAEGGRTGEVRFLGEVENSPLPIERTIKRLAGRYDRLNVCFEAGPTGYGLSRPRLHGGRSGPDPEPVGRAHQDERAGCGHAGAAAFGRRTGGSLGARCASRGGARPCPRPRGGG